MRQKNREILLVAKRQLDGLAYCSSGGIADALCDVIESIDGVLSDEQEEVNTDNGKGVVIGVVCCGDCKHGQQDGENGVLCEFGCEEHRPYNHFCAWAERRTFNENNEEN